MTPMPIEAKSGISTAKIIGEGIDNATYHRQNAKRGAKDFIMSRGELCEFAACPSRWLAGVESEETKSTEWGTLIDCLAMTPEKFPDLFAVTPETYPDKKTGEAKDWNWNATVCKEWREALNGKEAVKYETKCKADEAVKVLFSDERVKELIQGSKKQVMVIGEYQDKETGLVVPIKGLIDLVPSLESSQPKCLIDFKTCANGCPGAWPNAVFEHNYHVQAALYLDLYVSATGEDRCSFLHILQESFAPYQVGRRLLSSEFLNIGRMKYTSALRRYARCLSEGYFPGYDDEGREVIDGWNLTEPRPYMLMV